jgi:Co/Zn/Cd efflux system component
VADNKIGARFPALIGLVAAVLVLTILLYVLRGSFATFHLSKEQADFWDIVVKVVGGLVALIGAIVALSKSFQERAKANQAALIEAQKPFMRNARIFISSLFPQHPGLVIRPLM